MTLINVCMKLNAHAMYSFVIIIILVIFRSKAYNIAAACVHVRTTTSEHMNPHENVVCVLSTTYCIPLCLIYCLEYGTLTL